MSAAFANQVAVITGASSGIGWALARELSAQGARVGLLARRKDKLDELAGLIRQSGGTAEIAPADITNRQETVSAIRDLGGRLGPIDLLVANAGVGVPTLLDPVNTADVEQMFRVNVFGVVYSIEAVLPEMLRRRSGHIAAVSSVAGLKGLPAESGYCATKAAVNAYMEGLRIHLRDKCIAVTTICPGFVRTPMTDINEFHMPWVMGPEQAARLMARALARRRKVYTFPWQMRLLMWATGWMPDWMIARSMHDYLERPPMAPLK